MAFYHYHSGHRLSSIHEYYLTDYFPELWLQSDHRTLDLRVLADQIHASLPHRSRKSILTPLKSLFGLLKNPDLHGVTTRIERYLHNLFDRDTLDFTHFGGLQKSRNAFAALAGLAQLAGGDQLGMTLIDVFWRRRRDILDYERSGKLFEWALALELLRGLVDDHENNRCLQYLARKHNHGFDFGRGRHLRRPEYYPMPRARTMPPIYYRPRIAPHPGYLPLPPPEPMHYALPSPAHSMGHFDPYHDAEMEEMKMEQEVLAQKVNQLEWNQAEINAEIGVQAPMPSMRAIGY